MTNEEVLQVMGTATVQTWSGIYRDVKVTNPWRVEAYKADGKTFNVLFYYTDRKAADGAITDDELTPIVLVDGKVQGWGWSYWESTATRYDIRIRR